MENQREQYEKQLRNMATQGIIREEDVHELLTEYDNSILDVENDMYSIPVNFINKSNNQDPDYTKDGDSGFDLRAFTKDGITIKPLERKLIPTGLYFEIPYGLELQVRPRSGLALKNGITVLNSPGTVDSGYRGEVGVILINLGQDDFTINNGDRIAQGVIAPVTMKSMIRFNKTDKLSDSDRGEGGFGSSGVQ
jgi:dUTP pyrophosphatase